MQQNDPNQQYDGVIFGQFEGLKNTTSRERLKPSDLERAQNVDIDNAGQIRSRRGYAKKIAEPCHSLFTASNATYVVKSDVLGVLNPDFSFIPLKSGIGSEPLAYVEAAGEVFFTSPIVSGRIKNGIVSDWGAYTDQGLWLSPVVNPTDTLPEIRGLWLGKPRMASALTYFQGRIYLAQDTLVWLTMLYNYSYVDRTRNFYQFEHPVVCIGAVTDGVYVGTEHDIWFLSGIHAEGMKRIPLASFGMLKGSMLSMPAEYLKPQIQDQVPPSKNAVVFMTDEGMVAGFDGGQMFNLTQPDFIFPAGRAAASMYRHQDGMSQFVTAIESGGTPTDSARIGDYVDAEIVREVDRISLITPPGVPVVTVSPSLYKIGFWFNYPPLPGETLIIHDVISAFTIEKNFEGSRARCGVNPASNWVASVKKNGVEIGTIAISIVGAVTFTLQTATKFFPGDVLQVDAPATADLTIAACAFTLRGE